MKEDLIIEMGEEKGIFTVHDERDALTFETPVLEQVEYISPSVKEYVAQANKDRYLSAQGLFIDFEDNTFYLRGSWDFLGIGAEEFDRLLIFLQENASEIKEALYKACCQDLVYMVANKAYAQN